MRYARDDHFRELLRVNWPGNAYPVLLICGCLSFRGHGRRGLALGAHAVRGKGRGQPPKNLQITDLQYKCSGNTDNGQ